VIIVVRAALCLPDRHKEKYPVRRLPRDVWALGLVSLFMDTSSEMIHGLLPVFLIGTLGLTPLVVGAIDGIAEAVVYVTKPFSGVWSDRSGRRKPLLLMGYGLAAVSKPIFPLASSAWLVLGARLLDRFGKGIRGAPRDALIADVTEEAQRGAAYGLRQSMDTVGAFLGPLAAIALMELYDDNVRHVFYWAILPALLSVLTIALLVREPEAEARPAETAAERWPIRARELRQLGLHFWMVIAVGAAIGLARFSEAFLLLRVQAAGIPAAWVPGTLIVMNVVYAGSAYPAGRLSDRTPRQRLLLVSTLLLAVAQLLLSMPGLATLTAGVILWGFHLGASQGVLAALVADHSPTHLRGTAFGVFNLVAGVATILASGVAGALWTFAGPAATFVAGAVMAILASLLLMSRKLESIAGAPTLDQ
jgi:MFS family permease